MSTFLKAALSLAAKGQYVFPCAKGEKHPITTNGLYDASIDDHDLKQWWEATPDANIGLPTGFKNGFTVLDVDAKHNGLETIATIQEHLSPTFTVQTGNGGMHYYFKYVNGLKNLVDFLPGLDIRNDGGYVLAPGSFTNGLYEIIDDRPLAPFPDYLIELIKNKPSPINDKTNKESVPEGHRNQFISSLAGLLRRKNVSLNAAIQCALEENKTKCSPPLDDNEVMKTITSIYSYPSHQHSLYDDVEAYLKGGVHDAVFKVVTNDNTANEDNLSHTTETEWVSGGDLVKEMIDFLNNKDLVNGEPTGFANLDTLLGGGKRLGEVTAWHAHAKTGKNAYWHKLMHMWVSKGIPIGYASRELSPAREALPNFLSIEFKENVWKEKNTEKYLKPLSEWPLYFAKGYGHFPIDQLERWVIQLKEKGVNHFWFDHLHYMLVDPEDHKEASILIKRIKTMAIELMIHIDIIVQPNKLLPEQNLGLQSIKGGAAIGQAVDNLFILEREKEMTDVMRVCLSVARSRQARPGNAWFKYNKDTTDFEVFEPNKEPILPAPPMSGRTMPTPVSPIKPMAKWASKAPYQPEF